MTIITFDIITEEIGNTKPGLVFGPNLRKVFRSDDEGDKELLDAIKFSSFTGKTGANSSKSEGTTFFSIATSKNERNISKSGLTDGLEVVNWMKKSVSEQLSHIELEYQQRVNLNHFCLVGEDYNDLQGLVAMVARSFPLYGEKKSDRANESRTIHLQFSYYDKFLSRNESKNLLYLLDNYRQAARIGDLPPNLLHPGTFEDLVENLFQRNDSVKFEVFDHDELGRKNMNLLKSVGEGSPEGKKARMCILKYEPEYDPKNGNLKTIALVGKGITYDTGGHSLKDKIGMPGMKKDCAGAAGMLFAFKQLVDTGFKAANLICILCIAENNIGPEATKPDDIYIGHSGLSVEINNTDAEGRLALADGVSYATRDLNADVVIDMCTLTGAVRQAVGKNHGALLTNNPKMEQIAIQAGLNTGDHIYPVIYSPKLFMSEFSSKVADMKNHTNDINGNTSAAGHFIEQHLKDGVDYKGTWMHIDMSGAAMNMYDWHWNECRHSGYGVGLVSNLVEDISK